MAIRTRAAVLEKKNSPLLIREIELAPPGPDEVLVKMEMAGLCRSDLNAVTGHTRYNMPLVLGHEGAGTVVETGCGVKGVKSGDRVALSWAAYCGECYFCRRHQTHLCSSVAWPRGRGLLPDGSTRFRDSSSKDIYHFNGVSSLSEYTVVYKTGCVPVSRDVPLEVAAATGCSVVTAFGAVFRTAGEIMESGATCMVVGGGCVGTALIEALRLKGAGRIILIDRDKKKWKAGLADHYGRSIVPAEIEELTEGVGPDMVFDCVASEETIARSMAAVRRGGTVVMVGAPHPLMKVELNAVDFHLEKKLIGSLYGSSDPVRDMPRIFDLYEWGLLGLEGSAALTYGLDDINLALKTLEKEGGKITVNFG
ncbi:MAG: alcohol dehydrogenase catalytic domain-containing protein [Thermodesulfobacteriota bacterium]